MVEACLFDQSGGGGQHTTQTNHMPSLGVVSFVLGYLCPIKVVKIRQTEETKLCPPPLGNGAVGVLQHGQLKLAMPCFFGALGALQHKATSMVHFWGAFMCFIGSHSSFWGIF